MNMKMSWVKEGDTHVLMCGDMKVGKVWRGHRQFAYTAKGIGGCVSGDNEPTLRRAKAAAEAYMRENMPKPAPRPKMQTWSVGVAKFYGRKDGYYVRLAPAERVSVHRTWRNSLSGLIAEFPSVGAGGKGVNNNHVEAISAARAFVRMMNGAA